jgi:hypothetical protein
MGVGRETAGVPSFSGDMCLGVYLGESSRGLSPTCNRIDRDIDHIDADNDDLDEDNDHVAEDGDASMKTAAASTTTVDQVDEDIDSIDEDQRPRRQGERFHR